MQLDPKKMYDLLSEKGISHLHHANTVTTALTFIEAKGLLSRGAVERKNLYQTMQDSDLKDKRFNIWDDIFLDTHDLHSHFPRQNHYGPVLFQFSTKFLLKTKSEIWVTRDNPTRWRTTMKDREKYFANMKQLRDSWDGYRPERRMITIRNIARPILFKHLEAIVLDHPEIQVGDIDLYTTARYALRRAIVNANLRVTVSARTTHQRGCFCVENYEEMTTSEQLMKFLPLEKFRQK
jgi:hypothetical protein